MCEGVLGGCGACEWGLGCVRGVHEGCVKGV